MCGRFVIASASAELVEPLSVDRLEADLGPSWNVAPTTLINALYARPEDDERGGGRHLGAARWGLLAPWSKTPKDGARAFNARVESAGSKPTFRASVTSRRAVVPMNGYYEWHRTGDRKQPYFVHDPDADLIAMAGLYAWWRDPAAESPDRERVLSATILTRAGGGPIEWLHDRMPVLLSPDDLDEWLDPASAGDQTMLDDFAARGLAQSERLDARRVGPAVGNVRNNDPSLVDEQPAA